MSTCAQNQSNDDDSSGAESNTLSSNAAFDAAVASGHFLNSSVGKSVAPNGLGARASIQVRQFLRSSWSRRSKSPSDLKLFSPKQIGFHHSVFVILLQGGPAVMPMAPMGVSPRLMSQMGMRFPTGAPGPGTPGHIRSPVRFPGPGGATYLM